MSELKASMPTNDERREVSARMREYADFDFDDSNPLWYIMKAVYGDVARHGENELFAKLADLIEPTERTCYMNEYDVEGYTVPESICGDGFCSECDGIIAVEDRYCRHCGAKVVGK